MQATQQSKNASNSNVHSSAPFFKKEGETDILSQSQDTSQPFFSSDFIQPKLAMGQPSDKYEQEADTMAEKVVGSSDSSFLAPLVQTKCDECQSEEVQAKEEGSDLEVQHKSIFESDSDDTQTGIRKPVLNPQIPKASMGAPKLSRKSASNGDQMLTQSIPITTYIAKEPSSSEDEKTGGEQKEENISVDKIEGSEEPISSNSDSTINASFTHSPTVARGGAGPNGFGVTRSRIRFTNVNISSSIGTVFNNGIYTVTADMEHTITWQVRSGTGPGSQVDIAGATDSDLKACNYQLVSKDLTPNMSSDNGRPPRSNYWAEDLTIRHELFHAQDQRRDDYGPAMTTAAQTWLNTQTASSASQVRNTLMPQARNQGVAAFNAKVALPSAEGDAYGDGAPLYLARANSIKSKGDAGDYGFVTTEVKVLPKGGGTHTVVEGDTLWDIAEQTYGNPKLWREIHGANPGKARDGGNLIFPGQVFDLPHINIDQQLFVILSFGTKTVITSAQTVSGGGSALFFNLPSELFEDTTNCTGDIAVEVWDATDPTGSGVFTNRLLNSVWSIPANATLRNGNIEVDLSLEP